MKYRVVPMTFVAVVSLVCAAIVPVAVAQPPADAPPPEVGVIAVTTQNLPVQFEYIGVTEASKTVEARSRIRGFVESRDFKDGAIVARGEVLFTIDPRPFQADLEIAAAQVAQAEARLHLANQEVARLQSVTEPAAIAQSDLDTRIAEQSNAAASLRLAKAQLAKAELELSYTKVGSPLDGFVGKALKDIGSLVDDGQNSLLAMVWQVDPMYVSFQVTEREFLKLRTESESGGLMLEDAQPPYVAVTLLNDTTLDQRGTIDFESAVVDVLTGSVEMRAVLDNPNAEIKPGQFVRVALVGWSRPNVIAVPQRAVGLSPQGAYVYVVGEGNVAEFRNIETGSWSGDQWIVQKGLNPGDRVVVEGLIKVQPGIEVVPHALETDALSVAKN